MSQTRDKTSRATGHETDAPIKLDIAQVVAHNHARIEHEGDLIRVVTPGEQWSYAAAFRFERALLPSAERVSILVDLTITGGRVGLLCVSDALNEAVGSDQERSVADGRTSVELVVDQPPPTGWIVIRNNSPGGLSAACLVHQISARAVAPGPAMLSASPLWEGRDSATKTASFDLEQFERSIFEALRRKWSEVPAGLQGRRKTLDLLSLGDSALVEVWNDANRDATAGPAYSARGWYHDLYVDVLRGKRVLDVGSGLGFDGVHFARSGARVTFLDIVPDNLDLLQRLCKLLHVNVEDFFCLHDFASFEHLEREFDVIWCQGSMMNAPFEFSRLEAQRLLEHLPCGGRWIELAYPRERWQREGSLPFAEWGKITDGAATPWMEWYDLPRLLERLEPAEFEPLLNFNFHRDDFVWFDLIRRK